MESLKERILSLERASAPLLEPDRQNREDIRNEVVAYTESFLDHIEELNAFNPSADKGAGLLENPVGETGRSVEELIRLIYKEVDTPGLNPASGGHLGYIPGGGIYHSALGDYMADISNRYAGIFFAGPGAVRMENMLLRWAAGIVGYPDTAAGNHTSGGSLANLIGIVSGREAKGIRARNVEKSVIYLSRQAHHSVDKAIRIAGLGEAILRYVPLDEGYRMRPDALREMIADDKAKGLHTWLLIASAGTTDVGAVDPLDALGEIAKEYGLWFHVDAAYGGFFMLTEEGRRKMKGIEKSDSVVMDPHKGLFLPYGSGIVLVKDRKPLQQAHYYQANYMQDAASSNEEISPADLSPELTKHFRGMRLWLPLMLLGVKPFREALEEKLLLAKYFHQEIQKIEGFEVGPEPELSVVTYRYIPKHGDANTFNERLVQAVQNDGRVFISSTMLEGKFTLRLAVLSFRTHLRTIDLLLEVLKEKLALMKEMV